MAMKEEHAVVLDFLPHGYPFDKRPIHKKTPIAQAIGKNRLTETAKSELNYIVEEIVVKNEPKFVEFFNKIGPINTRVHQLELLPGIGKKHMLSILEEREKKPFESFKDIKERVKLLPDPEKTIAKRILLELEGNEKHYLFVRG